MGAKRVVSILGLFLVVLVAGCGSRTLTIGPVPVTLPVIVGARISPDDFLPKQDVGQITYEVSLHDLPTAAAIRQMVADHAGEFVASRIELTALELAEVVATATTGDFGTLHSVDLQYVRDEGVSPVVIGSVSSEDGFGTVIDFDVPPGVDLLDMLPTGDEAPGYPKLASALTGAVPAADIVFNVDFVADAYAKVTL